MLTIRSWARPLRGLALAFAFVIAAPLAQAPAALAHARVETTAPLRGEVVDRQPAAVTFSFDEPVEGSFGAVRVFDSSAARVDAGASFHPGGRGKALAVGLRPRLPQGTYTATFRVVSADGHPISGGFVFSIGKTGAAPADTVAQLAGKAGAGPVTSTAFAAVRAVQYAAIAAAIGLLAFVLLVWPSRLESPPLVRRAARTLRWIAVAGAVTAVLAVLLEGAVGAGTSLPSALTTQVVGDTLGTRFGLAWALAALAWITAGIVSVLSIRPIVCVPIVPLVLLPALGGHAATLHPAAVMIPANVLHVAAVSVWFGGILALITVLPAATTAVPLEVRSPVLASVMPRFSVVAIAAVATLTVSGTVQALFELTGVDDLVDTAFGRAITVKVLLLGAAGTFAVRNHRRTVPALVAAAEAGARPGAAGRALRSAVRAEVALIVAVFGATGALSGYPPPTQLAAGPFSITTSIGPEQLQLTVDPARPGANQIHVYLLQPKDGSPFEGTKELTMQATERERDIGPLDLDPRLSGPGHYVANAAPLPVQGRWRLTVTARVSDFDEYTRVIEVPVR